VPHPDVETAVREIVEEGQLRGQADRVGRASCRTAKPIRIREVRGATTLASGMGSQYTLSPVKLCSVSQMPSKPTASAKHACVATSWMAAKSASGDGDRPRVNQPKRILML